MDISVQIILVKQGMDYMVRVCLVLYGKSMFSFIAYNLVSQTVFQSGYIILLSHQQ